jgi:hypothetical protein
MIAVCIKQCSFAIHQVYAISSQGELIIIKVIFILLVVLYCYTSLAVGILLSRAKIGYPAKMEDPA